MIRFTENFMNVRELRKNLNRLKDLFPRRRKGAEENCFVYVIMKYGKPISVVMPYDAYTRIREFLIIIKAQADIQAGGRVIPFPTGTTAKEALKVILGRKSTTRSRVRKAAKR